MKKQYISPSTLPLHFVQPRQMLCASGDKEKVTVDTDEGHGGTDNFSQRQGTNIWGNTDVWGNTSKGGVWD